MCLYVYIAFILLCITCEYSALCQNAQLKQNIELLYNFQDFIRFVRVSHVLTSQHSGTVLKYIVPSNENGMTVS